MRDLQGSRTVTVDQTISKATEVGKRLQTPEGMLGQIEFFVGPIAFLLLFLMAFGSLRRRNNNTMLKVVLWAAYTLSGYLITYTLWLMCDTPFHNPLFSLRTTFLMIFLGSSNSFSSYSLKDDEQWKKYAWQHIVTFMGTTKLTSEYMSSEHQLSDPCNLDPIQMRGYKYVVRGEETGWIDGSPLKITDEIVTVEKMWACQGWLLSSSGGDEDCKLKDICLSFSLYKLLALRFCSYSLPKEAHKKLWKFIRNEENGYERAFRVIELELSFLFDSFYTKYPIIFQSGCWKLKLMEISLLFIGSLVTIVFCFLPYNMNVGFLLTSLILTACTCVELLQFFLMAFSEWAKVLLLCKYIRTNSWQESKRIRKLIGLICRTQILKPWERKLRQYTILESHGYTPPRWICIPAKAGYIHRVRRGKKQSPPAKLSSEVKRAVFHSLKSYTGVLENGEASLRLNKVAGKLSWACRLETQTRVIIAWHVATSICEHEVRISDSNFLVATILSKYLAYLVAFSPKLLPDCPDDTEYVFDQTILQSRELLEGCKTGEERIRKLEEFGKAVDDTNSVIKWGAQLGQQLLKDKKDPAFIWKVLAEFWAELMVYVAPSDDAKAHAENLAIGGEFVTHLWALVSHADIKRGPPAEQPTLKRSQSWSN
ncbi:hypothetical protein BT93_D1242 [Corymbia citriodora subsp. variegata]|nr:hypothetical protein BT93_D1242 [Corymbia citriodora subsp. variegata]